MESRFAEQLMEYLTARRMISLKNLAEQFDSTVAGIVPAVKQLESEKRIRVAMSRCSTDCSSCSSCGPEGSKSATLTDTSIIISLERAEEFD